MAFHFFSVGYERSVLLPFPYGSTPLFDALYVAIVFYAAWHAAVAEAEHKPATRCLEL